MKKVIATLLILFSCVSIRLVAQDIETIIVGEWKIDSVSANKDLKLNNEEKEDLQHMMKATLEFTEDHHAKFHLTFSKYNVGNGYWYFDPKFDVIRITKWNDRKVDRVRLWYDIYDADRLKLYFDEKDFSYVLYVSRKK